MSFSTSASNPLFPSLTPRLVDPQWFSVDAPKDENSELEKLEKEHASSLKAVAEKDITVLPIGELTHRFAWVGVLTTSGVQRFSKAKIRQILISGKTSPETDEDEEEEEDDDQDNDDNDDSMSHDEDDDTETDINFGGGTPS